MSPPKRCRILCAGIVVLDELFRVTDFPPPDGKVEASAYVTNDGGNAANAAIASRGLAAARATQGLSAGLKWHALLWQPDHTDTGNSRPSSEGFSNIFYASRFLTDMVENSSNAWAVAKRFGLDRGPTHGRH